MKDIRNLIGKYKKFINSDEGKKWNGERKEKQKREIYSKYLSKDRIMNLSEKQFDLLVKSLWASDFWTNKDYLVKKILGQNIDFSHIKESLYNLLYTDDPLYKRYDNFRQNVKGIGPSMLTELMTFVEPKKYCIWNEKSKAVLPFLEMDKRLPERVFKYQIRGKDYENCIQVLSNIKDELKSDFQDPDFIDLDSLLWFICTNILRTQNDYMCSFCGTIFNTRSELDNHVKMTHQEPPPGQEERNHLKAQKTLVEIGILFGYDTYVPSEDRGKINNVTLKEIPGFTYPHLLDTIKHIDVIWFKEEFPAYCFEVEESTDVTKGLLRLYQIRNLKVIPIIVGPESKKIKFQKETEKEPFRNIRKRYRFISYEALFQFMEISKQFYYLKDKLLGECV